MPVVDGIEPANQGLGVTPAVGPIKRRELIRLLKKCGFEGPYAGAKHEFILKGDVTLRLPNLH